MVSTTITSLEQHETLEGSLRLRAIDVREHPVRAARIACKDTVQTTILQDNSPVPTPARILKSARYHAYTLWLFTYSSHKDTVYPSVLFALSTCLSELTSPFSQLSPLITSSLSQDPTPPLSQILVRIPYSLFWAWLALLVFSLHNQHSPSSVLEDKINKPWRALPSGRITPSQTRWLLLGVYPVWMGVSFLLGAIWPCVILTLLTWYYCELGGCEKGGFARNGLNAAGYSCFFAGALLALLGNLAGLSLGGDVSTLEGGVYSGGNAVWPRHVYSGKTSLWLAMVCGVVFSTIHTQDFRDEEGDRARGRKTVQTALGDTPSRILAVFAAGTWSVLIPTTFGMRFEVGMTLCVMAGIMGWFLLGHRKRTVARDILAYKAWIAWFTAVILSPLLQTAIDILYTI